MKGDRIALGVLGTIVTALLLSYYFSGKATARAESVSYPGDALIAQSVKSHLSKHKDAGKTLISVRAVDGDVLLSGFASTDEEKLSAERVAQRVTGVKSVTNEVVVRP